MKLCYADELGAYRSILPIDSANQHYPLSLKLHKEDFQVYQIANSYNTNSFAQTIEGLHKDLTKNLWHSPTALRKDWRYYLKNAFSVLEKPYYTYFQMCEKFTSRLGPKSEGGEAEKV